MSISSLGSTTPYDAYLSSLTASSSVSVSTSTSLGSSEISSILGSQNTWPQDTFQSGSVSGADSGSSGISPQEARSSRQASDLLDSSASRAASMPRRSRARAIPAARPRPTPSPRSSRA